MHRIKKFLFQIFGIETHEAMLARKRRTRWRRVYVGGTNKMGWGKYGRRPRYAK